MDNFIKELENKRKYEHRYKPQIRELFSEIAKNIDKDFLNSNPFILYGLFETGFLAGVSVLMKEFEAEYNKLKVDNNKGQG